MNAFNLLMPDGTPSRVWACGECRFLSSDEAMAVACCTPLPCRYCGEPTDRLRSPHVVSAHHDACRRREEARYEAERLDRAEKLETWDGWVYAEGRGYRDGYFESLEDFIEYIHDRDEPADWPEWVHVCEVVPFRGLDIGSLIENVTEDSYEDADDDLEGVKELERAVNAFNAANVGLVSYEPDYKRAVRVPREAVSEPEATTASEQGGV